MANIYVRSTDGSDADNGSTWALAKATLAGAAAIDTSSDTIYVSQSHAESSASAQTIALAGTLTSPEKVLCVNDAAEPPTTSSTAATVTTTGASSITVTGVGYMRGISFIVGSSTNTASFNCTGGNPFEFENCNFTLGNTSSSSLLDFFGSATRVLKNCGFKLGATTQAIRPAPVTTIEGGSILSGSSTPSAGAIKLPSQGGVITFSGFDFSNFSSTVNLLTDPGITTNVYFRNCKLPDSWTGNLWNTVPSFPGCRAEMHNCDSAGTDYRLWVHDYAGSIKTETTLVKTGGASDGTTTFSWKLASTANTVYPSINLATPELPAKWNTTVGSSVTITVDTLLDSATGLKNDELWLEVQYLGTTGRPLSTFISSTKSEILGSGATNTSSTATWTTTGMSNPNKQKMSVTFTPQSIGYIQAKVYLAKPSTTVYIDPVLQVS